MGPSIIEANGVSNTCFVIGSVQGFGGRRLLPDVVLLSLCPGGGGAGGGAGAGAGAGLRGQGERGVEVSEPEKALDVK